MPLPSSFLRSHREQMPCSLHRSVFAFVCILSALSQQHSGVFAQQPGTQTYPVLILNNSLHNANYVHLPSDIVTNESKVAPHLTVTKASSLTRTTSTVRPWPSHHFFKSVLAKSDNVASKRSRPKAARNRGGTGVRSRNLPTTITPLKQTKLSNAPENQELIAKYVANHKKQKYVNLLENEITSFYQTQSKAPGNTVEGKSRSASLPERIRKTNVNSQRKISDSFQQKSVQQTTGNFEKEQKSIATSQYDNLVFHPVKGDRRKSKFARINDPGVGFQYEIVVPSDTPSSPKYTIDNTFMYVTTTFMPTFMSETNTNEKDTQDLSTFVTKEAVKDTDIANSSSPTTPIFLSKSQQKTKAVQITSDYHTDYKILSQNIQKTPTHQFQLNMHLEPGSILSDAKAAKSESKNENVTHSKHLSHSEAHHSDSEAHTKIKTSDLRTINHVSTTTASYTTTSITASTFLPTVKRDGERTSNEIPLTTLSTGITRNFGEGQPTQFTTQPDSIQMGILQQSTFDTGGGSNQSSQRQDKRTREKMINAKNPPIQTNAFDGNQTTVISRRNMFTVVNKIKSKPKIYVERMNETSSKKIDPNNLLLTIEKASVTPIQPELSNHSINFTSTNSGYQGHILTGPDRTVKLGNVENDNDYFDEDDTQANLHHWIESEQGQSVTPSIELPRFTNLTWPYQITKPTTNSSSSHIAPSTPVAAAPAASTSAGYSVSFTSQRDKKNPDFYSRYEFYIPSAAADPQQKPILVTKKRNKTATTTLETWTRVPTQAGPVVVTTEKMSGDIGNKMYHLNQNGENSKIKHNHWGSKGLNIKLKPQKAKPFSQLLKQKQENNIKVYESSTGKPKSTTSKLFFTTNSHKSPITFPIGKYQNHILTSPSSVSSWPFGGEGHAEIASFVTAKTPTNIWYKPTINHFTASLPINGTVFHENEKLFHAFVASTTTTMKPETSTTKQPDYVYVGDKGTPANKDKVEQGEYDTDNIANGTTGNDNSISNSSEDVKKHTILFKVWGFQNGKLKLRNQKEIPSWALQGYIIPENGTILNLKQIPQALQPLVTSEMNKKEETSQGLNNGENKPYIWQQLPIFGSSTSTLSSTTPSSSADSLFEGEENQLKVVPSPSSTTGWSSINSEEQVDKQPISINYVLWNKPASIYGQSIILSTPHPPLRLSQPTPVTYFPPSPITPETYTLHSGATFGIRNPASGSPITPATTISHEQMEALFQSYFQHLTTQKSTTTITSSSIPIPSKASTSHVVANANVWNDFRELIERLALSNNQASITLEKEKPEDFELLGHVAAIALLTSYLQSQYKRNSTASQHSTTTSTTAPYGVTDDMTPPHKDQLWATVYPLFQHFLNNPNYTFVPPPTSSTQELVSHQNLLSSPSLTPTTLVPTEYSDPTANDINRFNHYVSYYPAVPPSSTPSPYSVDHISITEISVHGATTSAYNEKLGELGDSVETAFSSDKLKTLLLLHKLKKKKKKLKKYKRKKKAKVTNALLGAALIKKISKPLLHVVKKPSKYWLDLKFDIDFYELLKKKLLYFLAYRYMPVFMILAFGLIPVTLSLVPLLYKMYLLKWKKKNVVKIKIPIPIPYPKPYPVPIYQHHHRPPPPPPPRHYYPDHPHREHDYHHGHSPPGGFEKNPDGGYEHDDHKNEDVIHIDGTPPAYDHNYAAATTGTGPNDKIKNDHINDYHYQNKPPPQSLFRGSQQHRDILNSFNYNENNSKPSHDNRYYANSYNPNIPITNPTQDDQEIHVHLHDDESTYPDFQHLSPTNFPSQYTSYRTKDLQPNGVTNSYELGYGLGQKLSEVTNKQDMEILKILIENKKEKLNSLLNMWNLAKYGISLATEAAIGTTPSYGGVGKQRRKRRRTRKRRRKLE